MCGVEFEVTFPAEVFGLSFGQDNGIDTMIVGGDGMSGLVDNAIAEGICWFKPPTRGIT